MIKVSKTTSSSLNEIQIGLDGITATLAQLEAQLHAVEQMWDGDAREAFVAAETRWRRQLAVLNTLASNARRFSQTNVDNVTSFDSRRANAWKR